MSTPKDKPKPAAEEIEWTDEDDAIMLKAWAELRKKGVKADPVRPTVKPVKKPTRSTAS